ncbi:hypothetical protein [Mycolicibacterium hodleri]|uniref:hypothetical protein n=1 Tax=Mycolicibacterium hodleri TaxID=49897 RepID=UPI0021F31F13|nr:hypothetical protein [Mycolicibacterium hodleri]
MNTWGMRKTIGAVAVAAAVAGVGGAAIAAATETGGHGGPGGFGDFAGFAGFEGPPGSPLGAHRSEAEPASLHGEYVVADDHGGYSTMMTQTGAITAISPTSVTARSADGFTQTYGIREVENASAPPFAVGDTVVIKATRQGEAAMVSSMGPPLSPGH